MLNIKLLRGIIRENMVLSREIRQSTGLSWITLLRKLHDPKKFTLGEIVTIKGLLGLSLEDTINTFAPFVAFYNSEDENND